MATSGTRIPYTALTERMQRVLPDADAQRIDQLSALQVLRTAKASGHARELVRLQAKLGATDARVVAMAAKVDTQQTFLRQLGAEVERAGTPVVTADEATWVLHGRVRDQELTGLPGRKVVLVDATGAKQFAAAQTDTTGYFKIDAPIAGWQKLAAAIEGKRSAKSTAPPPALYVQVQGAGKSAAYQDARPLVPSGGTVMYLEIVLATDTSSVRTRRRRAR